MSKELSQKRVFSEVDFKNADRIDRMYIYLLDKGRFELNLTDRTYLSILKRAYAILCEGKPRRETVKLIAYLEDEAETNVYRIIRDAQNLYARFEDVDRRIQRGILREKLELLAQKAEEKDDLFQARLCYEALSRLDGLNRVDDEKPKKTELPKVVIFTNNPQALAAQQQIETDDLAEDAVLE